MSGRRLVSRLAAAVGVGLVLAPPLDAQGVEAGLRPRPRLEARLDVLRARATAVQAGAGIQLPLGNYVRLGVIAAAGATMEAGRSEPSARADLVARFLLDPVGQHARGPYVGGGLSTRYDGPGTLRPLLVLVVGIEGGQGRGVTPALEVGLGGGVRAGVVLRQSRPPWR